MTLTAPGLIVLIAIAAICGAVGKALADGGQGGLVVSIALCFMGALLGPWAAHQLNLTEPLVLHVRVASRFRLCGRSSAPPSS